MKDLVFIIIINLGKNVINGGTLKKFNIIIINTQEFILQFDLILLIIEFQLFFFINLYRIIEDKV